MIGPGFLAGPDLIWIISGSDRFRFPRGPGWSHFPSGANWLPLYLVPIGSRIPEGADWPRIIRGPDFSGLYWVLIIFQGGEGRDWTQRVSIFSGFLEATFGPTI